MKQSSTERLPDIKRLDRLQQAFDQRHPHISKADLAREASYSYEYVIRIFSGERRVSDAAIEQFAPILKVRKEYLYGYDNIMTEQAYRAAMDFADKYTALIRLALTDYKYQLLDSKYDLSIHDGEMNSFSMSSLRNFVAEGYHPILLMEDDDDFSEFEFSVLDNQSYFELVRDIQSFIKVKVQQAFEDNYMKTQFQATMDYFGI